MILMIDNYDSFTFNLVQYASELGAKLQVFRNDKIKVSDIQKLAPQGIIISPGPGRPENAGNIVEIVRELGPQVPIFGVCLGYQAIGYAYGAKLVQARKIFHGKVSEIFHDQKDIFNKINSPFKATRYHSLVLSKENFPENELEICAWTKQDTLMGLRHRKYPIWGVQFHPESILTQSGHQMIKNFLNLCTARVAG